jgi:nitroimidazol reductase NimA-like FMN-containing flavoprotein (pyridoxamine 5'-phosphate oxidase superfamily)
MTRMTDLAADARRIINANVYLTLATAGADGRPWASPVWFAHEDYARFLWVSKPEARHSRNLAERPQTAFVIFDSTPRREALEAVYVEAEVEQLGEDADERHIAAFSGRSEALGWPAWSVEEVRPPAPLRLYLATAGAQFVLGPNDERIAVALG